MAELIKVLLWTILLEPKEPCNRLAAPVLPLYCVEWGVKLYSNQPTNDILNLVHKGAAVLSEAASGYLSTEATCYRHHMALIHNFLGVNL